MKKITLVVAVMVLIFTSSLLSGCSTIQEKIMNSNPTDTVTSFFDYLKIQDTETLNKLYFGSAEDLKIGRADKYINESFGEQTEKMIYSKLLEFTYIIENEIIITHEEEESENGEEEESENGEEEESENGEDEESENGEDEESDCNEDDETDKKQNIMVPSGEIDTLTAASIRAEELQIANALKKEEDAKLGKNKGLILDESLETATVEVTITTVNYGQIVNEALKRYFHDMAATANPGEVVDLSIYQLEVLILDNITRTPKDYEAKFIIPLTKYEDGWRVDSFSIKSPFFNAYYGNAEGTVPPEPLPPS